ncbi:MAG: PKD domain-containing protein, partial [Candidatus Bipolaricaulota bacterium]
HQYADDGAYTVTLEVTDDDGATDSTSHSVTVSNQAPIASFVYGPSEPEINEIVDFDASGSYDPDGSIEEYEWDFGDSSTGIGQKPAHSYSDNNTYTATLTVTDDDGATDSTSKNVTVAGPNVPPEIELKVPAGEQIWKGTEEIEWQASDPDDRKDSLEITFSYSSDNGITWNTIATDTENDGAYSWDTTKVVNGEYKVKILVEDPGGLTAEGVSTPFTINNALLGVELISYGPNPVLSQGCVFWLNLPDDTLGATLKIFDIDGAELLGICLDPSVDRYPQTGRWLPQDDQGRLLGSGLYLYVVEIKHTDGATTYSFIHKMVIGR